MTLILRCICGFRTPMGTVDQRELRIPAKAVMSSIVR